MDDGTTIVVPTNFTAIRVDRRGTAKLLMPIGSGPYEQRTARAALRSGDSLIIFDPSLARRTTFVGGRATAMAPWVLRSIISIVRVPNGFIANAAVRTPGSAGFPLHLVDSAGTVVRSMGEELNSADPVSMRMVQRVLANGRVTCPVISAIFWRFSVECLAADGTVLSAFRTPPSWWEGAIPSADDERLGKPAPAIVSIHEESNGLILVVAAIASSDWRNARAISTDQSSGRRVLEFSSSRTSMAVTIDPKTQRISPPTAIPGYVVGSAPGRLFVYREHKDTSEPMLLELTLRIPR